MHIGVLKEIKNHEYRVGLVPASVRELTKRGHSVWVEHGAGEGIGFSDGDYIAVGAQIAPTAQDALDSAELIIKVKEPQPEECAKFKPHHVLFTYLHLAPDPIQAKGLVDSGCVAIAYETVTDRNGGLPLLAPMSEVAGRMSVQVAAAYLEKEKGGSGVLMGGVPGVRPANVLVVGGGVVGSNAARIACGMGASVTIIDRNSRRLSELDLQFDGRIKTLAANHDNISRAVAEADVVIGAVLVMGAAAPKIVSRETIATMAKGSVVVDVAIDQGGCFETSRPTSHANPVYVEEGVIHYCVTNMPGAVARTSAMALNNATLPYVLALADKGYKKALMDDEYFRQGLNVAGGFITQKVVADELGLPYKAPEECLN